MGTYLVPGRLLYAEWGYVIDLDGDGWFEVHRGMQTKPHRLGRFSDMEPDRRS